MLPSSSLTDPDVQFFRFRFFMEELRSRECSDGRSGLLAEGDALGVRRSDSIGTGSGDPAATTISARSSRPDRRTNLFAESCPMCRSRHSGPASSRSDGVLVGATQFLEEADQGQAFAWRFAFIRRQQLLEFIAPSSDLGERLKFSLVAELSRARADHLPYDFARYAQFPADRFDRLTLPKERTSIFAIVSTTSIPTSASTNSGKPMWTLC